MLVPDSVALAVSAVSVAVKDSVAVPVAVTDPVRLAVLDPVKLPVTRVVVGTPSITSHNVL